VVRGRRAFLTRRGRRLPLFRKSWSPVLELGMLELWADPERRLKVRAYPVPAERVVDSRSVRA